MDIKEATFKFVSELNRFPRDMIERLMDINPFEWRELTYPSVGDRVYVLTEGEYATVAEISDDGETYTLEETYNGMPLAVNRKDIEHEYYDGLPMWGTLWQFGDSSDDYWLEHRNGIFTMSKLGFRVYEHEDWGYFFGIDGAGYNFYENHWIPLYKARGLHWHDKDSQE